MTTNSADQLDYSASQPESIILANTFTAFNKFCNKHWL